MDSASIWCKRSTMNISGLQVWRESFKLKSHHDNEVAQDRVKAFQKRNGFGAVISAHVKFQRAGNLVGVVGHDAQVIDAPGRSAKRGSCEA
jgi:hypothetical protein